MNEMERKSELIGNKVFSVFRAHRALVLDLKRDYKSCYALCEAMTESPQIWKKDGGIERDINLLGKLTNRIKWREVASAKLEERHSKAIKTFLNTTPPSRKTIELAECFVQQRAFMVSQAPMGNPSRGERLGRLLHRVLHELGNITRMSRSVAMCVSPMLTFLDFLPGRPEAQEFAEYQRQLLYVKVTSEKLLAINEKSCFKVY